MIETMPARKNSLLNLIGWPFPEEFSWPAHWRDMFVPELRVEEYAESEQFVIKVEAAGIDPDKDVEVSVARGMLLIKVQRRSETRDDKAGSFRSEFSYGAFERRIALPEGSDAEDVKATYRDGILEIRMPLKAKEQATAQVPVTRV